ncbi:MAG: HAMP domain-containing protein, partial [Cyanobacteria bacterium P01_A01_bin.135]
MTNGSLYRKIYLGYSVTILATVAGIGAGLMMTRVTEQSAQSIHAEADEDVEVLNELKNSLLAWLFHSQLVVQQIEQGAGPTLGAGGTGLERQPSLDPLAEDYARLQQAWEAFKQSDESAGPSEDNEALGVTEVEAAVAAAVVEKYDATIAAYLQRFTPLLKAVEPSNPTQQAQRRADLAALYQSNVIADLDDLLAQLAILMEEAKQEQQEARALHQGAYRARQQIIVLSLALSSLLGLTLMGLISRAICRPLEEITKKTQQSIPEDSPTLQVPVTSQDEIGLLAQALNNYAHRNAQLLRQHQQTNQQLKATLNELNLAQLQMIQQEKMSSLGHLIAGIA